MLVSHRKHVVRLPIWLPCLLNVGCGVLQVNFATNGVSLPRPPAI